MKLNIIIECHYAEYRVFLMVMLSVIMLNVVMLSVMAPLSEANIKLCFSEMFAKDKHSSLFVWTVSDNELFYKVIFVARQEWSPQ